MVVAALMLAAELFFWQAIPHLLDLAGASVSTFYAVASFVVALWSAGAWALLLLGVVRLAAGLARAAAPGGAPPPDPAA